MKLSENQAGARSIPIAFELKGSTNVHSRRKR